MFRFIAILVAATTTGVAIYDYQSLTLGICTAILVIVVSLMALHLRAMNMRHARRMMRRTNRPLTQSARASLLKQAG